MGQNMEYLMLGEFWREVGLTVAARLSVVAVALWAVKMVTDHLKGVSIVGTEAAGPPILPQNPPLPKVATPERTGVFHPVGGGHRRLSIKKPPPDPWRTKMGKYLSGEPVVTSQPPRPQR
jgi:hypothetical protein